eukprot:TRINITY_DN9133_c0_g1_i1.p1 TRINITY_DN9133_c0_g1~~TRINITY_DN9133_c0_g1_i1.p1  ORF type:complete len:145 (-),score=32.70 TRINITY_DN9133_c0_g1_i1:295-729(-)
MENPVEKYSLYQLIEPWLGPFYQNHNLVWSLLILFCILYTTGLWDKFWLWWEKKWIEIKYGKPKYDDPEVVDYIKRHKALTVSRLQTEHEIEAERYKLVEIELKRQKEERKARQEAEAPSVHMGSTSGGGGHWTPTKNCGPRGG